jgi:hypothetical protein
MQAQPYLVNTPFPPNIELILTESTYSARKILVISALAIAKIFSDNSLSYVYTFAAFPLAIALYDRVIILRNVRAIRADPQAAGILNSHNQIDGQLLLQAICRNTIITGGPLLRTIVRLFL